MKAKLTTVISESGIWKGNRSASHAFLLSPSTYQITEVQKKELEYLGYALNDCLLGLSHIGVILGESNLSYPGSWNLIRKVFRTGIPKFYQDLQALNHKHIPKLLKLDLMVDQNGKYKIAEIDGHNKHGLGYSTMGLRFRESLYPDSKTLSGAVRTLSEEIKRLGYTKLNLFYADQERFYIPEFEVAQQEFMKYGIDCFLLSEMDANEELVKEGLFLDLPFLNHNVYLYDSILSSYKEGKVKFIIPPKPFFGSKGVLGLLRNDIADEHLEAILCSFIKKQSLELVRSYIPETLFIGKDIDKIKKHLSEKSYVLKESISSGMKGVYFSSNDDFSEALKRALESGTNWILQEEITNQPQSFSWYEPSSSTLNEANDWLMRVTVHYVNRNLADIIVTARRDRSVHGAKDCIQLGTVIV